MSNTLANRIADVDRYNKEVVPMLKEGCYRPRVSHVTRPLTADQVKELKVILNSGKTDPMYEAPQETWAVAESAPQSDIADRIRAATMMFDDATSYLIGNQ